MHQLVTLTVGANQHGRSHTIRIRRPQPAPVRTWPYDLEPGFYEQGSLWLYGNVRLLQLELACVQPSLFLTEPASRATLNQIEEEAESHALAGRILVCGVHNEAHQRAAVVPLRWGAPRIVVFSGGFSHHLGADLKQEPFRLGRLWRYQWDKLTDLAVSRRAPDQLPSYASKNFTVDRMIDLLVQGAWPGLVAGGKPLENILGRTA